MGKLWAVVRCSSQKTFQTAEQLTQDGIESWAPAWYRRRRLPRTKKDVVVPMPCLPSFVFVSLKDLEATVDLSDQTQFRFRLMTNPDGTVIRIPDEQLEGLRKVMDRPKEDVKKIPRPVIGSVWRFGSGPFDGLDGEVLGYQGSYASVKMKGLTDLVVQIPYFQLGAISIELHDVR